RRRRRVGRFAAVTPGHGTLGGETRSVTAESDGKNRAAGRTGVRSSTPPRLTRTFPSTRPSSGHRRAAPRPSSSIVLVGVQRVLTHVPPILPFSIRATRLPAPASDRERGLFACPAPTSTASKASGRPAIDPRSSTVPSAASQDRTSYKDATIRAVG